MNKKFFSLDLPIIQAPMAGGITTPELVASVSNTGALGSLGAGYMQPEEIRMAIREIKRLTKKPFNVNLFIPENNSSNYNFSAMQQLLQPLWKELLTEPLDFNKVEQPNFADQIEVILEEHVPVFSFTFGVLSSSFVNRFKAQGTLLFGTATTPDEAEILERSGMDAVVCQGVESGGHRGGFSSIDPLYALLPLLLLTKEKVKIPLIAAGGLMDGKSVHSTFLLGASAAQLGTAFITTKESGASSTYKKALLQKPSIETTLTNVFTGKIARAINNKFIQSLQGQMIPPYPLQHYLTQNLRALASEKQRADLMSLWAGQGYPFCRSIDAEKLILEIAKSLKDLIC